MEAAHAHLKIPRLVAAEDFIRYIAAIGNFKKHDKDLSKDAKYPEKALTGSNRENLFPCPHSRSLP